jgi:hypothetical protein
MAEANEDTQAIPGDEHILGKLIGMYILLAST